ncbi:MAG: hypothetical protein V1797_12405 [Pseudomonadota bacterium]
MAPARALAADYQACLAPAQAIFRRLCPVLCPDCAKPCCLRVSTRGVFDQPDLVVIAALNLPLIAAPPPSTSGCPFLLPQGCALPWPARPFTCLHYVCPPLTAALSAAEKASVEAGLVRAAELRSELMAALVDLPGGDE